MNNKLNKEIGWWQKGQSVMEYMILSSLIGIFCLVALKQFGETVKNRIDHMKSSVVKQIKI